MSYRYWSRLGQKHQRFSKGVLPAESCPIYKLDFLFFHRRFFSIDEPYNHTPNPVKPINKITNSSSGRVLVIYKNIQQFSCTFI